MVNLLVSILLLASNNAYTQGPLECPLAINSAINICTNSVNNEKTTAQIKELLISTMGKYADTLCAKEIKNITTFIENKRALKNRSLCSSSTLDTVALKKNALWDENLIKKYDQDIKKFYSDTTGAMMITYHKTNDLFFRGSVHMDKFTDAQRIDMNGKFLQKLIDLNSTSKLDSIIIEKSDEEISCKEFIPMVFAKKEDILKGQESSIAAWFAINNGIKLRGGEPFYKDFANLYPKVTDGNLKAEDYDYMMLYRCIAQITQKGEGITKDSNLSGKWSSSYTGCKQSFSDKDDPNNSQLLLGMQDAKFEGWFSKKLANGVLPKPYENTVACTCTNPQNAKAIVESPCCNFVSNPSINMSKESMSYVTSTAGKIKNYCLVKNMLEAVKAGNTFVVYGGGHLFETYDNMATVMCDDNSTCPSPKLTSAN